MKTLKLLNKKYFSIILILLFGLSSYAEEKPVDIWNIEQKEIEKKSLETSKNKIQINENEDSNIYNIESQEKLSPVSFDKNLEAEKIKIIGLYDPEDYDLNINMWSNSDGDQLKALFTKLNKMNLSQDAIEIINISLLTNAYHPQKNISEKEFLKFKSDWLIKNSNLELIEEYLINNQAINLHPELSKFVVDQHLSNTNIDKACEIIWYISWINFF